MGDRSLTLTVAEETLAALEKLASESGCSPDQLVGEALERYVDYESWKSEKIRRALAEAESGVEGVPHEEVFRRLRARLDDRDKSSG